MSLGDLFAESAQLEPGEAPADLSESLQALWERARAAWPGIEVAAEAFVAHVARHKPEDVAPGEFLRTVYGEDLYLAAACLSGHPAALNALEEQHLSRVPGVLRRLSAAPDLAAEVQQVLRERLLVGTDERGPRIAQYSGQGTLKGWLRVSALRTAHSLLRRRPDSPLPEELDEEHELAAAVDPDLALLRARYGGELLQALRDALAQLSAEQRNLLRMYFEDGLTIDQIAPLFRIHRATAARRLRDLRETISLKTRELLRERLQIQSAELDSLIRAVHSQLDVSLRALLRECGSGG